MVSQPTKLGYSPISKYVRQLYWTGISCHLVVPKFLIIWNFQNDQCQNLSTSFSVHFTDVFNDFTTLNLTNIRIKYSYNIFINKINVQ
jgi:hypothetical protein